MEAAEGPLAEARGRAKKWPRLPGPSPSLDFRNALKGGEGGKGGKGHPRMTGLLKIP